MTGGSVTIFVETSISEGKVESITLPNGKVVTASEAEYEVTKNGEYEFIVATESGINVTKSITVDNISDVSADNPYIPEGFSHVEGTEVDTGYVIEDEQGNQFVWVPVPTGKLIRNTSNNEQYVEIDETATGLYNSVTKYYGFYIARYEASKSVDNSVVIASSRAGAMPWSNVNYTEAYEACQKSSEVYGYTDVKTAILNSYAWDTTLAWINENVSNYSSNTSYGNYSGTISRTGETELDQVNAICDLAGNLREWTTEVFYPDTTETNEENQNSVNNQVEVDENGEPIEENVVKYRVVRGGSANINKVANSHTGNPETMSDPFWGFRMILYKD